MLDIGFSELLLVALLALIVVGPQDLPKLVRRISGFVRQARAHAAEFRHAFEEMDAGDITPTTQARRIADDTKPPPPDSGA